MAPLTADQITALTRRGANRWRKKWMDRVYISLQSLDCYSARTENNETRVYLGGEEVDRRFVNAYLSTKVWVDVRTGDVSVDIPWNFSHSDDQRDKDMAERITTICEESAKSYLTAVFSVAGQEAEERRAKSISSAVLDWTKGTVISIDGRGFVVGGTATSISPSTDRVGMKGDARLIVRQSDSKYRCVELTEIGDGFVEG